MMFKRENFIAMYNCFHENSSSAQEKQYLSKFFHYIFDESDLTLQEFISNEIYLVKNISTADYGRGIQTFSGLSAKFSIEFNKTNEIDYGEMNDSIFTDLLLVKASFQNRWMLFIIEVLIRASIIDCSSEEIDFLVAEFEKSFLVKSESEDYLSDLINNSIVPAYAAEEANENLKNSRIQKLARKYQVKLDGK